MVDWSIVDRSQCGLNLVDRRSIVDRSNPPSNLVDPWSIIDDWSIIEVDWWILSETAGSLHHPHEFTHGSKHNLPLSTGGPQTSQKTLTRADLRAPAHRPGPTHRAPHGQGSTCNRARDRSTHQFGRLVDSGSITVWPQFGGSG